MLSAQYWSCCCLYHRSQCCIFILYQSYFNTEECLSNGETFLRDRTNYMVYKPLSQFQDVALEPPSVSTNYTLNHSLRFAMLLVFTLSLIQLHDLVSYADPTRGCQSLSMMIRMIFALGNCLLGANITSRSIATMGISAEATLVSAICKGGTISFESNAKGMD